MDSQSEYQIQDLARMSVARNYFAWQGRLILREIGARVLEYGCGIGNFTGGLLSAAPDLVVAVDPDAAAVAQLVTRYPAACAIAGDPREMLAELAAFHFDTIVCNNVLEHIEDDGAAIATMAQLIDPGGVIVLFVPAFPSLFGPIDRALGHVRRYTRDSLRHLAKSNGLRIRRLHYVNFIGFFGWWINARILKLSKQSPAQIALFDRVVVPVLSRIESVIPPPLGQSLFAVLEKPR